MVARQISMIINKANFLLCAVAAVIVTVLVCLHNKQPIAASIKKLCCSCKLALWYKTLLYTIANTVRELLNTMLLN